eukprot:GHVN01052503.1.p1 GENE.GHVN01052503.1~~GHVN01052503.1.p1  ORF type:complete len:130 (-),score=3.24 GHVN01052503.1:456-845(-)
MTWKPKKCKVLHIGSQNPHYEYKIHNTRIEPVHTHKDLGTTISKDLKFNTHIDNIVKRARQVLGQIRRTHWSKDPQLLKHLYITYIRPHLEAGSLIWSPQQKMAIEKVEKVQRRATKMISSIADPIDNG